MASERIRHGKEGTVSKDSSRRCLFRPKAQHLAFGAIKVLLLSTVTAFSDRSCPYQSRAIRARRKRVSDWGETGGRAGSGRVCKTDFQQHSKDKEWSSVGTSAIKERDVLKSRAVCRRWDRGRAGVTQPTLVARPTESASRSRHCTIHSSVQRRRKPLNGSPRHCGTPALPRRADTIVAPEKGRRSVGFRDQ